MPHKSVMASGTQQNHSNGHEMKITTTSYNIYKVCFFKKNCQPSGGAVAVKQQPADRDTISRHIQTYFESGHWHQGLLFVFNVPWSPWNTACLLSGNRGETHRGKGNGNKKYPINFQL